MRGQKPKRLPPKKPKSIPKSNGVAKPKAGKYKRRDMRAEE